MTWLSKSSTAVEPESPIDGNKERLAQIESELPIKTAARDQIRKEVRELRQHVKDRRTTVLPTGLFVSIGAMNMDTPHVALERAQRRADATVDNLLAERADLLKKIGAIR
jgi:hypothetical protein